MAIENEKAGQLSGQVWVRLDSILNRMLESREFYRIVDEIDVDYAQDPDFTDEDGFTLIDTVEVVEGNLVSLYVYPLSNHPSDFKNVWVVPADWDITIKT